MAEMTRQRWLVGSTVLLAGAITASWAAYAWRSLTFWGPFRWFGIDYGYYYAQTVALWSGDSTAMYRLGPLTEALQRLAPYTVQSDMPLSGGHVPYPPLFAWLFTPFTLLDPRGGLLLWTAVNLAGALWLAWRCARLFPPRWRVVAGLLTATSYPVAWSLFVGQPVPLLACAVAEGYLALRAGQERRAGLWFAALALKPQYAVVLGVLLLWKRRWQVIVGGLVGLVAVLTLSLLVAGPQALLAYPGSMLGEESDGLRNPNAFPWMMINWRALVLLVAPDIGERTGLLLVLSLGLLTGVMVLWVWRGRWDPQGPDFPRQMAALLVGTLLLSYHSHAHGAALVALPLASVLAEGGLSRAARRVVLTATVAVSSVNLVAILGMPLPFAAWTLLAVLMPFVLALLVLGASGRVGSLAAPLGRGRWHRKAALNPISTVAAQ